ncbi:O-acyltransferase like protein [Echeneis naucrates]|uniref:O-acyltransferase like protein n=1 Tax=Echeneis naucrates TaxID=173247 RepID=UPI0011137C90|nr:O-acyltransferase like protein-like [Echeneis naucrates]
MALGCVVFCLFVGFTSALGKTLAWNVTQKCEEDTKTFLKEITQETPEEYAVLFYDAFGKMGSDVEGGNVNQVGSQQECESAHGPTFSGQYCQLFLHQGTLRYFVGICVPDSCSQEDVEMLVLHGRLQLGQTSLIPPFPSILVNESTQQLSMTVCMSGINTPDASGITCLFICCVVVAIPLAATLFTATVRWQNKRKVSPSVESSTLKSDIDLYGTMPANEPSVSENSSTPVLNDNAKNWLRRMKGNPFYVLSNSGPVCLAVDTFLLLGGLLSARTLMGSISRAEDKFSIKVVAKYLFNRIKRIQPLHLFIVTLSIVLGSLVQWGPYQSQNVTSLIDCKKGWWANVLLISNLVPFMETCTPWSWYLSLDFQCYATTPVLLYLYRLNRGVFAAVAAGLLLMTVLIGAVITALMRLPVAHSILDSPEYLIEYYSKPYTRYGPFLIGILTGIYLTAKTDQLIKQKWQAALGWFCCLSLMALVIGLAFPLQDTPSYPSVPHALYQGLHRSLWALTLTWIILACEDGYGGFINRFLSWDLWVPLSNISFACYMIHPIFIILYMGLQETPMHDTDMNLMYQYLATCVLSMGTSYFLTVLIEKPFRLLKCGCA